MIIKVTMTREEMVTLRLENKLTKTLVVKLIRAGVVLEATVDHDQPRPAYRIVGSWDIDERDLMGSLVQELRVIQ